MTNWDSFVRRHNASIFDVFFKDIDYGLNEEDIKNIILGTAEFFQISPPNVLKTCEEFIQVKIYNGSNSNVYELSYNLEHMKEAGINNRDTFTLCLTHELCHEYNKNITFLFCRNQRWVHELACDYVCGIRSCEMDLATGKYKFVVGKTPLSLSHPPGEVREEIVDYARDFYRRLSTDEKREVDFQSSMEGFPAFMYKHALYLNAKYREALDIEYSANRDCEKMSLDDIMKLPDTNLLKRYLTTLHNKNLGGNGNE